MEFAEYPASAAPRASIAVRYQVITNGTLLNPERLMPWRGSAPTSRSRLQRHPLLLVGDPQTRRPTRALHSTFIGPTDVNCL